MLNTLQHVYPDTALIAHFYKPVLDRDKNYLSSADRINLINAFHIYPAAYDSAINIIKQKNYQQTLIEITYGANPLYRDSLLKRTIKFHDSLIYGYLLRNGSLLPTNQFVIALKYKKILQIRPTLIDTLVFHAMYLQQQQDSLYAKDPFTKTDFKAYEATQLNELLTEDQYTKLLTLKNRSQARLDADDDWDDMEKWGLSKMMDKDSVKKILLDYYLLKWNAYYRMANNKLKQEANLKVLKDNQPKPFKNAQCREKNNLILLMIIQI